MVRDTITVAEVMRWPGTVLSPDMTTAEADAVLERHFVWNFTYQSPIEPHCTVARWDHSRDAVTVWSSTQVPHYLHKQLSRVLELPMASIRVIRPYVGGGFGVKAEATALDFCSVYLSKLSGRPVRMVYTREEMFAHHRGRHKQHMDLKIGVTRDGKITAVDFTSVLDGGAYTSFGVITAYYAGFMIPTLYHIPNYRYTGRRMYTNRPPCGAMRGHGVPQPKRFARRDHQRQVRLIGRCAALSSGARCAGRGRQFPAA